MGPRRLNRRLAAILAADIVGYSRLMGEDQSGTLDALRQLRGELFEPVVGAHRGNVVKRMGDGWIVEFPSISDAVACAIAIQQGLTGHKIIKLRMGIHTGEVVFEADDVFGDGVNIAARLEALAEPGQVLISDMARNSLDGKTVEQFGGGQSHNLKNIDRPVAIWTWPSSKKFTAPTPAPELALPERPSIAVLPFDNMSQDPEQEHFADGMTEDLITDLSKISGLFVVARNSSMVFKGQAVDVREAAVRLGVRYILEGSVRKAGSRVRINVQLIDAISGGHMWAERYDGSIEDVFELQDDVGANVVSALSIHLSSDEDDRLSRVHTQNLDAYELYVQAKATPYPPMPDRIKAASDMFQRVIEMDPKFAGGYAGLSWTISIAAMFGHLDIEEMAKRASGLAHKAVELDDSFGWSHVALSLANLLQMKHSAAIAAVDKAIECQPNDADAHAYRGIILAFDGRPEMGIEPIETAIRLNPQFINGPYLNIRGAILMFANDYSGSVRSFEENFNRQGPVGSPLLAWTAAAYRENGNQSQSQKIKDQLTQNFPEFRLNGWNFLKLTRLPDVRQRIHDQMVSAGVPE